jgi:hypothetical protein
VSAATTLWRHAFASGEGPGTAAIPVECT